jgi:hypothetical protein
MSASKDREDRPLSAVAARKRVGDHLSELAAKAPRSGLGAATGHFIDHLVKLTGRYGMHLFVCFDDPRIPATTNEEEGFFGSAKRLFRHALGSSSTTNAVVGNLGADVLLAFADCRSPEALARIKDLKPDPVGFEKARARIAREEASAIRRRSMVRHLDRHLDDLRKRWFQPG